jgi:hypothetical protein
VLLICVRGLGSMVPTYRKYDDAWSFEFGGQH